MQPNWLWGYLLPVGLLLLSWGGLAPHKARRVTPLVALAIALAVLGYWAAGYAFHLGGAHAINPNDSELAGLDMMFAPSGWGLIGLKGFALSGHGVTPTVLYLFLAYLPIVATAVSLVVLALADVRRWVLIAAGALMGSVVFPLAACWAWGDGWLAALGQNLGLAHGFVDFGGSSLLLWLPAMMTTGILLFQERPVVAEPLPAPPAYFPLLANLGALLLGIGWIGWALSSPFHTYGATLDWNRAAVSVLLGITGAVLTSQLYAWLVTGEPEPLMAARGLAAGWGAALAGAPFLPPWAALIVGLLAGIFFPLILYVVESLARLRDSAATVALGLTGGLWGILSLALFADGQWGYGWNGIGAAESATPMGVSGIFGGGGQQLIAQLVGLTALGIWALLWGAILGFISNPKLPRRKSQVMAETDEVEVVEEEVETPEEAEEDIEETEGDSMVPAPAAPIETSLSNDSI